MNTILLLLILFQVSDFHTDYSPTMMDDFTAFLILVAMPLVLCLGILYVWIRMMIDEWKNR